MQGNRLAPASGPRFRGGDDENVALTKAAPLARPAIPALHGGVAAAAVCAGAEEWRRRNFGAILRRGTWDSAKELFGCPTTCAARSGTTRSRKLFTQSSKSAFWRATRRAPATSITTSCARAGR